MKILLTGRKGKLYETVARAFSSARRGQVEAIPVGSRLLEIAQSPSWECLVFSLHSEQDMEPLRWVLQQNRALPVVAVLSRRNSRLRDLLLEEGISRIVDVQGLTPAQIRRKLRQDLAALAKTPLGRPSPNPRWARELHAARSALTAILGNAEMALHKVAPSRPQRKPLEEIMRGVAEMERILRRLESGLKASGVLGE